MKTKLEKSIDESRLTSFKDVEPEEFFESRMELFSSLEFPNIKNPFWKYSSIKKLAETSTFETSSKGGHLKSVPKGVVYDKAINLLSSHKEFFEKACGETTHLKKSYFASLSSSLATPYVLVITKEYEDKTPLEITFTNSLDRLFVIIEEGVSVQIDEKVTRGAFQSIVIEYHLAHSSKLMLHNSSQDSEKRVIARYISVEKDAGFNQTIEQKKGDFLRDETTVHLLGANATAVIGGVINISKDTHSDTRLEIHQDSPDTNSKVLYRYLLDDFAIGIFGGKVMIPRGADRAVADMKSNAIVLSDTARVYGEPQFEIYNDDVQCTHGTSTGAVDEDALLYLQTRGVSLIEGKQLLLEGFLSEPLALVK